jgi:hypothetical protein
VQYLPGGEGKLRQPYKEDTAQNEQKLKRGRIPGERQEIKRRQ